MYQVLIWGKVDNDYNKYINLIKYQEAVGNFSIVGITGEDEIYDSLDGYHFIPQNELKGMNVDFIIVTSANYYEISNKAAQIFGNIEDKLILARAFALPEFDFSRYISLLRSHISIFAFNCWGGLTCHALGLPFRSPFVNMFFNECGYLELMRNPKYYLTQEVWFQRYEYEQTHKWNYPICKLGNSNIELHFNHYDSFEKAEEAWYKRIPRINWSNLFVMMSTSNRKIAEEFDELDYEKKSVLFHLKAR